MIYAVKKQKGYSLLEILVVLAIIGILAAIALPNYGSYVDRGRLTTAQSDLISLSLSLENQYQRILSYPTTDFTDTAELQAAFSNWKPASDSSYISFSTESSSASSYTLKATGTSSSGIDGCVISFTSAGVKSISSCAEFSSGDWL